MNSIEQQLLYCLAAYRLGKDTAELVPGLTAEQWTELQKLASLHKMGPMVFETLWRCPEFCGGDAQMIRSWKRDTLLKAAAQAMQSRRITEVSAGFSEHGIPHALLKGIICRDLYTRPDLRPSGDEDLLIFPEDQPRSRALLEQMGLRFMQGDDTVTHWQDPASGLHIELHTRLFSTGQKAEEKLNRILMDQLHHTVTASVTDGQVQTFSPTWHFIFLICHALKHFLTGGVGVRTLCDVVSYAEHYQKEIDFPAAECALESIRGRVFLDQIFAIGQRWLGFDPAGAGWTYARPPEPEEMLLDCLEAGIYGQSSMSRKHSAGLVLQAAEENAPRPSLRASLFPRREAMLRRYPELEQHPALLPICWVRRLGTYAKEIRHGGRENSPLESVSLGKKRTEMMVKYGILPKSKKKN